MIQSIKTRWARFAVVSITALAAATGGGIALARHAVASSGDSCCAPGAECCYPGSPCCAGHSKSAQR